MRKFLSILGAALLASAVQAQETTLEDPASAFGARESIADIALAPDGASIVYVAPGAGQAANVYSIDLETGEGNTVATSSGDPFFLNWCEYSGVERIVCGLYGVDRQGQYLFPVTRLISMNLDGTEAVSLGQRRSDYASYGRYNDGRIIDWLPGEDGEVLMSRVYVPEAFRTNTRIVDNSEGLGVDRIDTRTARSERVEAPRDTIGLYGSDRRGNVRIMGSLRRRGATGRADDTITFYYRTRDDDEWRDLGAYNFITRGGFQPLEVDAERNAVYGLQRHNGREALYRIALDGSGSEELVFAHDVVDVDNVVRIGRAGRIIGVTFAEDQRFTQYFDEEYAALAQALSQAIPDLPLVRFAGASDDENVLLLWAGSDSDPGRYFVYNKAERTLNEIMVARPRLENVALASVRSIRYQAADGTAIPGYLTLPPGRDDARGIPAVVMPHGGPGSRDEWGFDWLAQYFAHRGYAVLQPNFRGSAGYGDDWFVTNGFQNWETAIGDINAGGRWLVSEGIADPGQLAIVGWSYGGYAALQSGVLDPGLFGAIVAIAPFTDIGLELELTQNTTASANMREYLGERPHVRAGSPAQNAARITVPVIMFHGTNDANVDIRHAESMRDALRGAGKPVELIVYEGLEHSLRDSRVRAQMLWRSDRFLSETLGISGPPPRAPSEADD